MKSKIYTIDNSVLTIFLFTVFLLAFNKIHDTDAWMHLSLGRLIWDFNGLPTKELFVYPNFSEPFRYSSWLFAVLFYLAFYITGSAGLVFLKASTVTTAFFFLLCDSLRPLKNGTVAVLVLSVVAVIAMQRFVMRPDIFLMLFLSSTIFILNSYLYRQTPKGLYFLPVILFFWANIHTSVNLIVVPVGAFVMGSLLQKFLNQRGLSEAPFLSNRQIRLLLIFFGASFLLSLFNPNGFGQYGAGVRFIGSAFYKQEIMELLPPTGKLKMFLLVLAGLISASFLLNPKNISIIHLFLVAPFLVMPFMAIRFNYLMLIVGGPIFARNVTCFCKRRKRIRDAAQSSPMKVFAVIPILAVVGLYITDRVPNSSFVDYENQFGVGFDEALMPSGAVAFMDREGIYGRVFNSYDYGQYIIWTGYPKRQIFVDARGGLPADLMEKSSRFRLDKDGGILDELYAKYKFDSMLIPAAEIATSLSVLQKIDVAFHHPEWALVYWDDKSLLYLRRHGAYQQSIDRFEYKTINPDTTLNFFVSNLGDEKRRKALEAELTRNISETGSEKALLFLGLLYYGNRQYEKAISSWEKVLSGSSRNSMYKNNAYALMGDIYFVLGDFGKSLDYFQKAPGNEAIPNIQLSIGKILFSQGEIKKAIEHFERAIKLDKTSIQGHASLIEAYRADGQEAKAGAIQQTYDDLVKIQGPKMYFERGVIAQQKNDLDAAIVEYKKSLDLNPTAPVVCTNLGFVYLDKKQPDKAYEYFMKALAGKDDFADAHYGLALTYKENRDAAKAIEHFEKYCELKPTGYFTRSAREQIEALKLNTK